MAHRTVPEAAAAEVTEPPDIATMRGTVDRLLDPDSVPDALPPAGAELETLTAAVIGHLEILIPQAEAVADRPTVGLMARHGLIACISDARGRLASQPSARYGGPAGHARRLARALNALCNHYEELHQETRPVAPTRVKWCQRCGKPLLPGTYDRIDNERPTGPGTTVYVCKNWCKRANTQTSPVSRPEPIQEG
ncbi:DUF6415 family natural product biosynthesis protein [Streptomyces sp. SID13726]|uniref:DUF6415 family natural product biosynthesis protein n=1 Tax=Streptomyces sp. SID13726 TaxID=2706058 RepID=UPI0013B8E261|nr:DUF6415 family natural product biosynthesis protein [Streptomyces sp. SID13726]NEB05351.1 hypothetical protein [Streptomyces sp. SID13726]